MIGQAPVIAVTSDLTIEGHLLLRSDVIDRLRRAGATPIALPTGAPFKGFRDLFRRRTVAGLVVTGGDFHIPPSMYGETRRFPMLLKPKRTQFETAALKLCIQLNIPILGICGGMQLLNVIQGGSLVQSLPEETSAEIRHETDPRGRRAFHTVRIETETTLHRVFGVRQMIVPSTHHQGVLRLGRNLRVSARATDGLIEAVEFVPHSFCIGTQWHPERHNRDRLIAAFVHACRRRDRVSSKFK